MKSEYPYPCFKDNHYHFSSRFSVYYEGNQMYISQNSNTGWSIQPADSDVQSKLELIKEVRLFKGLSRI